MTTTPDQKSVEAVGEILTDNTRPLAERFRALFTLRSVGGEAAVAIISACFDDQSALLKHGCAYCLGQMRDERAIPVLSGVLEDQQQDTMVRHEAGEALGAIGTSDVLELLKKYCNDPVTEVAETCELAVERILWLQSAEAQKVSGPGPYTSIDPAPPYGDRSTENLRQLLLSENESLFERYRAMFALRNKGDTPSVLALAEGLKCTSALFRHEIAYVLGQMQHEAAVEQLKMNLTDSTENYMVRHECAEALGSIATNECMELLEKYLSDKEIVVKESCEVALDMCEYERSQQFQYADGLSRVKSPGGETCAS